MKNLELAHAQRREYKQAADSDDDADADAATATTNASPSAITTSDDDADADAAAPAPANEDVDADAVAEWNLRHPAGALLHPRDGQPRPHAASALRRPPPAHLHLRLELRAGRPAAAAVAGAAGWRGGRHTRARACTHARTPHVRTHARTHTHTQVVLGDDDLSATACAILPPTAGAGPPAARPGFAGLWVVCGADGSSVSLSLPAILRAAPATPRAVTVKVCYSGAAPAQEAWAGGGATLYLQAGGDWAGAAEGVAGAAGKDA
jgi:hypothetical protein